MFKSHVNLFSYIIITILPLQSGTIWKVNRSKGKNRCIKYQILSIAKHKFIIAKQYQNFKQKSSESWRKYLAIYKC